MQKASGLKVVIEVRGKRLFICIRWLGLVEMTRMLTNRTPHSKRNGLIILNLTLGFQNSTTMNVSHTLVTILTLINSIISKCRNNIHYYIPLKISKLCFINDM